MTSYFQSRSLFCNLLNIISFILKIKTTCFGIGYYIVVVATSILKLNQKLSPPVIWRLLLIILFSN
jgi:hypothetical protein